MCPEMAENHFQVLIRKAEAFRELLVEKHNLHIKITKEIIDAMSRSFDTEGTAKKEDIKVIISSMLYLEQTVRCTSKSSDLDPFMSVLLTY